MDARYVRFPRADYRFFLYDPEGEGMIYFPSAAERDDYAQDAIREWCLDGRWPEPDIMARICAGEVTAVVTQVDRQNRPPDTALDDEGRDKQGIEWGDYAYLCDYALRAIGKA
jgi:hypothetical protein